MQSFAAARSVHAFRSALAVRTFASSAVCAQAVPTQKPVLQKEFKIYRWVRFLVV